MIVILQTKDEKMIEMAKRLLDDFAHHAPTMGVDYRSPRELETTYNQEGKPVFGAIAVIHEAQQTSLEQRVADFNGKDPVFTLFIPELAT